MNDKYIARQPIFYKDMSIYGYKLFFHEDAGFFSSSENDDKSTASFIDNILLEEFDGLTDGGKGFIKFTGNLILKEAPLLFPNGNTIIEVQGDIELNKSFVAACKKLKDKGYKIAVDDFDMENPDKYASIIKYIDIAKIVFNSADYQKQEQLIKQYRKFFIFLAKKIETRQDFAKASKLGFKLFQGAFYSKPVTVSEKTIGTFSANLLHILNELHKEEPDFNAITEVFERDIDLSYKLLRMVNSAYYGMKYHTDSLRMALVQVGIKELIRWINVMILRGVQNPENAELIKASIIRAKMLALLAIITNKRKEESNYFISGMFSSIDVLLNKDMEKIIEKLPLGDDVCKTLMGENTPIKRALDVVKEYEKGNWNYMDAYLKEAGIAQEEFISLYIDAIKWQKTL